MSASISLLRKTTISGIGTLKLYECVFVLTSPKGRKFIRPLKLDIQPTTKQVLETVNSFVGKQLQTPPAFSAIKVGGQRAYKLARAGKEVVIEPREVTIHEIKDIKYDYPKIWFTADVSSGTYIRSLATDIGQKLGAGAYMSSLNRTQIDNFSLKDALVVEALDLSNIRDHLQK